MKEKKFRIWDLEEKFFHYWDITEQYPSVFIKSHIKEHTQEYAGVEDIKNIAIYEGDKVKDSDDFFGIGIIEQHKSLKGSLVVHYSTNAPGFGTYNFNHLINKQFEIIGHINEK